MAENSCVFVPEILLPNTDDMTAWACIACDQFTGNKEFWNKLEENVKGKKTTLDLFLPEIYLSDSENRIKVINGNIDKYLSDGVFQKLGKGFILTVRSTPFVKRRIGIIGAIDLEKYEYSKKSKALIRSTEGVIEERIPPRLKIRENAKVEFPHIMMLYDDEKKEIAENLYKNRKKLEKLYDFKLNMGGGKIEGYFIKDYDNVIKEFLKLLDSDRLIKKYGVDDKFAFAVGDGNHSLATAKASWNKIKENLSEEERQNHPARFALVEFNNIYDKGIYFEPIYRIVYVKDKEDFVKGLKGLNGGFYYTTLKKEIKLKGKNTLPQAIAEVDEYIKDYVSKNGGSVDYIHGKEDLLRLVKDNGAVGILFDKLNKKELFKFVVQNGSFPRKTFSMGEGIEKRYYLEGRKITL